MSDITDIIVKKSQIKFNSGYNSFIKLAHSDWQFRVSNKFVHSRYGGTSIGIIDEWDYLCTKDNGRHEKQIKGSEILERFAKYNSNQLIKSTTHNPNKLKAKKVDVDNDLFR